MIHHITNSARPRWRALVLVVAACLVPPGWALAQATIHQRAGEWVTQVGNGPARRSCLHEDVAWDRAGAMRRMRTMPGAQCTIGDMTTTATGASYVVSCVVNGTMHVTSHETWTMVGPDAFEDRASTHMDVGPMHDMTTVIHTHRTGPCQPGDRDF